MISGFAMCCGYYEKVKNNQVSLNQFYTRRYLKILPFFGLLVGIDLLVALTIGNGFSVSLLYEAFADLTLVFGFMPTSGMSVVGVGWTLGVIFGFYLLFPFFVWLIWNKRRAWIMLALSIVLNFVCEEYFLVNEVAAQCNTMRWLCYFILGGIVYLYREPIGAFLEDKKILAYIMILAGLIVVFIVPNCNTQTVADSFVNNIKYLVGFSLVLCGALMPNSRGLYNPVSKFVSKISLEIYISHMFIFRILEKLNLLHLVGNDFISWIIASIFVVGFTIAFAVCFQIFEKQVMKRIKIIKDKIIKKNVAD